MTNSNVDDHKSSLFIYGISMVLYFGGINYGYNLSVINAQLDFFAQLFAWNKSEQNLFESLISSSLLVGTIFGIITMWFTAEKFSRKAYTIFIDVLYGGGAAIMLIQNPYAIIVGRLIAGMAAGMTSVLLPTFLREIAPNKIRGRICGLFEVSIGIGGFLTYLMDIGLPQEDSSGKFDLDSQWWRIMYAFMILLSVIRTSLILILNLNSPLYLYLEGKDKECREMLNRIYKEEIVETYYNDLRFEKEALESEGSVTLKVLFTNYKKALILSCSIATFQQFTGITTIVFFTDSLFRKNTNGIISPETGRTLTITWGLTKFLLAFVAANVIDRFGRRPLLQFGSLGIILCLSALAVFQGLGYFVWTTVFLFVYVTFFSLSLGPTTWIFCAETLPAKGVTAAMFVLQISGFLNIFSFPYLVELIDYTGLYIFFAVWTIACFLVVQFFVPETAKKSRQEIQEIFSQNKGYGEKDTLILKTT